MMPAPAHSAEGAAPARARAESAAARATSDNTATTYILFASDAAALNGAAERTLDRLVARAGHGEKPRLRLVAHAGEGEDADRALRLSFSRVLAVRSYLVDHGIHSSRLDVRAVGNRPEDGGPGDRVDVVMIDR
jgi:outer membrane protein OmpA-like peptidoglycan-associated protein